MNPASGAISHKRFRFGATRAWRGLVLAVVVWGIVAAAPSQTRPPAQVPRGASQARPPEPPVPTGPVIYEGALAEDLDAALRAPGYFGGNARLLSLTSGRLQLSIDPKSDVVAIQPVAIEMVLQYRDRVIDTPGVYGYDWGSPVHLRYEWTFVPGPMGAGSNAAFAFVTVQERKSRATEEPGRPLSWKTGEVSKGLAEIQTTAKVAEPKYSKSEYRVSWSTDFFRGDRMFVLKPFNPPATPTPTPVIEAHNGFLTWYLGFSRLLRVSNNQINDARAVAASIALPLESARREQQRVVRVVAEALRARQAGEPTASSEITDRLAEKGRLLSEECRKYLARLDAVTANAKAAQGRVMAEFERGFDAYGGDSLPMWIRWREQFDVTTASLPFEMAIAAGEDVRLREAVERSDTQTLPGTLRVNLARAMIARGELALAINQLRRVLAVDPQNTNAKLLLARADIVVMKLSMRKAAGALGQARESFNRLLTAAGHAEHDLQPADWMPTATPDAVKLLAGGIDWLSLEAWEKVTHTAINVMDRSVGRTAGEARALWASEREHAGNFMAVPIMIRLREKGFTLEQMARMDTPTLKAAIPLNTSSGVPYTDAQVVRLGVAIKNALAFEDIAAIADREMDVEDLRRALDKPYFAPADMVETWVDEFGAMVVEQAIMLALPMAHLKAGGATVTEFLAHVTRYQQAAEWFGGTETGLRLLKSLKQYEVLQSDLIKAGTLKSYAGFAGLKGSEVVGMMMVSTYAVTLANAEGGEPAAAVAAVLSTMVTDLDLLTKWLAAGRVSTAAVVRVMETAIRQGQASVQRLEQGGASLKRLRDLSRPRPAGQALRPEDAAFVKQAEPLGATFIPNGDPLHDSTLPRAHLAEDVSAGATSDAARVSEAFESDLNTMKTRLSDDLKRAEAARLRLVGAQPAPAVQGPPRAPKAHGDYEIPLSPAPGSAWAQAEQALRDGEYGKAKLLYREAYDNFEMPEHLHNAFGRRLVQAANAAEEAAKQGKPLRLPLGPKQPTSAEFAPGEAKRVLVDKWHLKEAVLRSDKSVMSNVFKYADADGAYILKELEIGMFLDPDSTRAMALERLYEAADNEIVAARLMDALGLPCARVSAVPIPDANGEVSSIRLLFRNIDGDELTTLDAGQLLQYADDLSAQRAFGILIGDYDRKLGNVMLGKDGRVYYIDAGLAELRDYSLVADPNWLLRGRYEEGLFGRDHYYSRSWDEMQLLAGKHDSASIAAYDNAARTNLVERSLTAEGAEPMVKHIEDLLTPTIEKQGAILDLLTNAFRESRGNTKTVAELRRMARDTLTTMRIRAQRLREVLKQLNNRSGTSLPVRVPFMEWRVAA